MTTRHRPDLPTRTVCDFWLVATMATMATPRGRPLKKSVLGVLLGVYHPSIPPFIYFSRFTVAMVAMPREPTQTRGQCTKTPCRRCEGGRVRDSPSRMAALEREGAPALA
jgi:hypothetical protein